MYYSPDTAFKADVWLDAAVYRKQTGNPVYYDYHTNMWKALDQTKILDQPLPVLYAEQARRIRDRHSWISLLYSGGADSHNILMTFIKNGIHLDEVISATSSMGRKATFNEDPTNLHSEFDITTKPVLNWLAMRHPEIKITVVESTFGSVVTEAEASLESRITCHRLLQVFNSFERDVQVRSQDTVISGHDKPFILMIDGQPHFSFSNVIDTFTDRKWVPFYWDHTFPELHINQCRVLARHQISFSAENVKESQFQQKDQIKELLYGHTWHYGFQVNKINDYFLDNPYVEILRHLKPETWQAVQNIRSDLLNATHLSPSEVYPCRTEQFPLYLPPSF